jgi:N utilization substance protein B
MTSANDETLHVETMGDRRRARAVALQALYELDATSHDLETVLARRLEDDVTPPHAATYTRHLVHGVAANQSAIDEQIARAAPAWPLEQMSRVDKCILRLAIYEMLFETDFPARVAINEAVELAKLFGHETTPKFVNGVLGSIERSRRAPRPAESAVEAADEEPVEEPSRADQQSGLDPGRRNNGAG